MSEHKPDPSQPLHDQDYVARSYEQLPHGYAEGGWIDQQPPPGWTPPRKRRHIFRWVFLAIQLLFLAWVIGGAASSSTPKSCTGMTGQDLIACQDAGHLGTTFGVALVVFFWLAVDVILGVTWLIVRRRR